MVFLNQIYTKSGDAGQTGLGDGSRVAKTHERVVAYGTVDELNSVLGLVRTAELSEQIAWLEGCIDEINEPLEPLTSFVLPGGTPASAWLHLARTVCRRAEISVWTLKETEPVNEQVVCYLNRLSDLLFVLAQHCNDLGKSSVLWVPGANRGA